MQLSKCLLKLDKHNFKLVSSLMTTLAASDHSSFQVFSGIQPTGLPHLGNYFGAIEQWLQLANERQTVIHSPLPPNKWPKSFGFHDSTTQNSSQQVQKNHIIQLKKPIYAVVDVHSYSSKSTVFGQNLYECILDTVASLIALGLDGTNCILLRQSDILEHFYLDNVFDNFVSPYRLTKMTQFKDKTKSEVSKLNTNLSNNGLLTYPILQAADILVYRAQLVPVGEDQVQHLELARDLAQKFNSGTGSQYFPEPVPLFNPSQHARRVRSLRDPSKKMSKSDPNHRAHVSPLEPADMIKAKFKKALTDNIGDVYYEPEKRPAISNLMTIHHLATGIEFDHIQDEYSGIESARYKLILADIIIEKFREARKLYSELRTDKNYLEKTLQEGYNSAKPIVSDTISQVKYLLGSLR